MSYLPSKYTPEELRDLPDGPGKDMILELEAMREAKGDQFVDLIHLLMAVEAMVSMLQQSDSKTIHTIAELTGFAILDGIVLVSGLPREVFNEATEVIKSLLNKGKASKKTAEETVTTKESSTTILAPSSTKLQ